MKTRSENRLTDTETTRYDTGTMNAKQAIALAKYHGWVFVSQNGTGHMKFKHPRYSYPVVIPNHGAKDIGTGLAAKLRKQIEGRG